MIEGLRVLVLGVGVAGTSAVAACREMGAFAVTVDANGAADHLSVDELDLTQFDVVVCGLRASQRRYSRVRGRRA
jgi:UDP-N-acetylmuramoylalanine--D-glutamate ligase